MYSHEFYKKVARIFAKKIGKHFSNILFMPVMIPARFCEAVFAKEIKLCQMLSVVK